MDTTAPDVIVLARTWDKMSCCLFPDPFGRFSACRHVCLLVGADLFPICSTLEVGCKGNKGQDLCTGNLPLHGLYRTRILSEQSLEIPARGIFPYGDGTPWWFCRRNITKVFDSLRELRSLYPHKRQNIRHMADILSFVRVPGIEPGSFDWQPNVLPLNHTRYEIKSLHKSSIQHNIFTLRRLWPIVTVPTP